MNELMDHGKMVRCMDERMDKWMDGLKKRINKKRRKEERRRN